MFYPPELFNNNESKVKAGQYRNRRSISLWLLPEHIVVSSMALS